MKFTLRPYQVESKSLLRKEIVSGAKRPILCLPTGAGKTVTFSDIIESANKKGNKALVAAHRTELVDQSKKTVQAYGLNPLMNYFGTVQTFVRSPHKIPKDISLCIVDECHIGNFRRFLDLLPENVQVIGATATPISASNKDPLRNAFDAVCSPVQIHDLIDEGFLSSPTYKVWEVDGTLEKDRYGEFTVESQSKVFHIEDLSQAIQDRVGKTLIFASSIKATEEIANQFGIRFVHSRMKKRLREEVIQSFKETRNDVLVNCGILTTGFDDPAIETIILYRATTSLPLYLQMVGRGSRVIPEVKDHFNVFDLGGNVERLGLWESKRDWPALFQLQGLKVKESAAPMKNCVSCEALIFASQMVCPYCNAEQPNKPKEILKATKVRVINSYSELPGHLQKPFSQMTVEELIERSMYGSPRTGRPYKTAWIVHQLRGRDTFERDIYQFAEIKGFARGWVWRQLQNQHQ